MLTANRLPEKWVKFHRRKAEEAIGKLPIITFSYEPLDWGLNIIQTEYSITNYYRQILRGAHLAETSHIAIMEDDTLYSPEHFRYEFDTFAYNQNKWGLCTWGQPFYHHKQLRVTNSTLIAPREMTINALEERFSVYPNGLPSDRTCGLELGTSKRKDLKYDIRDHIRFVTIDPIVILDHPYGLDIKARSQTKRVYPIRAFDIPYWGKAEELRKFWE